jgi:UDP-N-acetyl-D-galactosamine dehydrogenase
MKEERIAIIGLGYVGLPLAIEFGKIYQTIGFDTNKSRIDELVEGKDSTREVPMQELKESTMLSYTTNVDDIEDCNIYIVTVPTPIDKLNNPNLEPLKNASMAVGKFLEREDIVIYESTVYPGATEEVCVPLLEESSGLKFNRDFYCGYSPERINPGDKKHRLPMIKKVTSGSTEEIAEKVDSLYKSIISAGTHKAESIKIAEAAKVIENTQRDVNIALVNELAKFFNKLGIDTESVLKAAETKWNFIPFVPGLVGGHCIGVDPYYLAHKAKEIGFDPEMIASGRTINNDMGSYIAIEVSKLMSKKRINLVDANILIMGLSFKENSPDIRNSGVARLVTTLESFNCNVHVYDPWIDKDEAKKEFDINLLEEPQRDKYDAIILAVAHDEFKKLSVEEIKAYGLNNHVLYDIKYLLDKSEVDGRL